MTCFVLSLLNLVNGPQALYLKLGCLKCIFGINLAPVNKSLFIILLILYFETKENLT